MMKTHTGNTSNLRWVHSEFGLFDLWLNVSTLCLIIEALDNQDQKFNNQLNEQSNFRVNLHPKKT
jgi:hypothetical protein